MSAKHIAGGGWTTHRKAPTPETIMSPELATEIEAIMNWVRANAPLSDRAYRLLDSNEEYRDIVLRTGTPATDGVPPQKATQSSKP